MPPSPAAALKNAPRNTLGRSQNYAGTLCDARTPPGAFWDTPELKSPSSNMLVLQCVCRRPVFYASTCHPDIIPLGTEALWFLPSRSRRIPCFVREGSLQHQPFMTLVRHKTTPTCHPDIIPSGTEALLAFPRRSRTKSQRFPGGIPCFVPPHVIPIEVLLVLPSRGIPAASTLQDIG